MDKNSRRQIFFHTIQMARRLCRLVNMANAALAPFLLCTYGFFLLGGVSYSYVSLAVLFWSKHSAGIFLASGFGIYALMGFFYMWGSSWFGEGLEKSKAKARYAKLA